MTVAETKDNTENIEAWAVVIEDLLQLMPIDQRAEVLALATKNNEVEYRKWEESGRSGLIASDITSETWMDSPGVRHHHAVMRLMSLVVQVFVRRITNSHSLKEAAEILFATHPHGHGSRRLRDYLDRPLSVANSAA